MDRPRIPLVLGVAGHRQPRAGDLPALRAAFAAVLAEFRRAYPHSPIVVLSSLAEGADLLAAEVALEGVPEGHIAVRAPLPMPATAYRASTSFSNATVQQSFDRALDDRRVEPLVVPLPGEAPLRSEAEWLALATEQAEAERDARHACYANAGVYVVRHCHALVAFWDGAEAEGPSGTGEIVRFMLEGRVPDTFPGRGLEPLGYGGDRGPVIVLHTPRTAADSRAAGTREVRLPSGASLGNVALARAVSSGQRFWRRVMTSLGHHGHDEQSRFRETCQAVDDFNRDVRRTDRALDRRLEALASNTVTPPLRRILAVGEAAGHLAGRHAKRLDRSQGVLFGLVLLAVAFFHLYAHWFTVEGGRSIHQPLFLWLFLGSLLAAASVVVAVWWLRLDERRLDYRALREALRVREAWARAGLEDSVADSYLNQLRGEMSWARRALLHICPPPRTWRDEFDALPEEARLERLRLVAKAWVAKQVGHFANAHKENHRKAARYRAGGFLLAVVGWVMAATLLASPPHPHHFTLILSGLLVLCGGVAIAICERRSHEDLAKQYERMFVVFTNGNRELQARLAERDVVGAQGVLRALGREAITEHVQWLILRRARGFELHVG